MGASLSQPGESLYRAGDVIASKYQLITPMGEGGMGTVWRARNTTLHVEVAIKLIHRDIGAGNWEEASRRLLKEARATAQLAHPSIVRVNDFGETEHGDPFIVMELLEGESLGQLLARKGNLPAINAVQMLLPIASALSEAHGKGIVHRDLKPDNIILVVDSSGNVVPKLLDFGIAKLGHEQVMAVDRTGLDDTEAQRRLAQRLTQFGALIGSPDYMSPEQARGDAHVDARTDLWSLCVMLYEAITGRRPFLADNVELLLLAILLQDPTPIMAHGAGDQELWRILARGLAKARAERWQDARSLGQALAEWLEDQHITTDVAGTELRQHWLAELTTAQQLAIELPAGSQPVPRRAANPTKARSGRKKLGLLAAAALIVAALTLALVTQPWRGEPATMDEASPEKSVKALAVASAPSAEVEAVAATASAVAATTASAAPSAPSAAVGPAKPPPRAAHSARSWPKPTKKPASTLPMPAAPNF